MGSMTSTSRTMRSFKTVWRQGVRCARAMPVRTKNFEPSGSSGPPKRLIIACAPEWRCQRQTIASNGRSGAPFIDSQLEAPLLQSLSKKDDFVDRKDSLSLTSQSFDIGLQDRQVNRYGVGQPVHETGYLQRIAKKSNRAVRAHWKDRFLRHVEQRMKSFQRGTVAPYGYDIVGIRNDSLTIAADELLKHFLCAWSRGGKKCDLHGQTTNEILLSRDAAGMSVTRQLYTRPVASNAY